MLQLKTLTTHKCDNFVLQLLKFIDVHSRSMLYGLTNHKKITWPTTKTAKNFIPNSWSPQHASFLHSTPISEAFLLPIMFDLFTSSSFHFLVPSNYNSCTLIDIDICFTCPEHLKWLCKSHSLLMKCRMSEFKSHLQLAMVYSHTHT